MSKWSLAGIHGINKYIWNLLQSELQYSTANYGGLIPITTPQQTPEFNSYNFPYLVYSYSKLPSGNSHYLDAETAAYTIFSASEDDIRKATNMLAAKLKRGDETAAEVNAFISANGSADQKEFDYKNIQVTTAQGVQPALQEGGRYDGLVVIKYVYTHYSPTTGIDPRV